jgi:hypothetical protein
MDFKKLFSVLVLVCFTGLAACTGQIAGDDSDDHGIGEKTTNTSSLITVDGTEPQNVVIFDKTVRRIHQFDLATMKHVRSFEVMNPGDEHFVLYSQNGNYIVDMSMKGLSIFNKYNQANHRPITFEGKPKSAAFNDVKGLLVVYDDLMTVGILKLDPNGEVLDKWKNGFGIGGNSTISSGDLNADGKLVLAMSSGEFAVVDIDGTLALQGTNRHWVYSSFATNLVDVKWVAALRQDPNRVLVRSAAEIALVDLSTQSVISRMNITDDVVKVSRYNDPHVIMRNSSAIKVVYVDGAQLKVKQFILGARNYSINGILNSNLNLTTDHWTFVDTSRRVRNIFNDLDETRTDRQFRRFLFNNSNNGPLSTENKAVPSDAQIELSTNFIFSLYPSELGYAVRSDINTDEKVEAKLFNLEYIPAN